MGVRIKIAQSAARGKRLQKSKGWVMTMVRRVLKFALVAVLLLVTFAAGWLAGRTGVGQGVDPASLNDRERQFTERMRGVNLVGSYNVAGTNRPPRADRYGIASVEKVGDNLWRFNASMDCCGVSGE